MEIFGVPGGLGLLDLLACSLLGAGASLRALNLGAQLVGAVILGIFCGLLGPLARQWLVQGYPVLQPFPLWALGGAVCGAVLSGIRLRGRKTVFFWIDGCGIGLAGSVGAVLGFAEGGIAGALLGALANGLCSGAVRDIALGDTAMFLDVPWYAAAGIFGPCLALLGAIGGALLLPGADIWHIPMWCCVAGALLTLGIRSRFA